MSDPRTEAEIAGGFIRITMGGTTREVPTLKIGAARAWKDGLGSHLSRLNALDLTLDPKDPDATVRSLTPLLNISTDAMIDILLSYDARSVLGGREWIEENADESEVYAALRKVLGVVFPFVLDARTLLETALPLVQRFVAQSGGSLSTSGLSPNGVSVLAGSKPTSTKGS